MRIEPYLFFGGRGDEAVAFYQQALGAEVVMLMRFSDCPDPQPAEMARLIMHCALRIGDTTVMLSDGDCAEPGSGGFRGISLSVACSDTEEAVRRFNALAEGGRITMPFGTTFFSPGFGAVEDRFGVGWMLVTEG